MPWRRIGCNAWEASCFNRLGVSASGGLKGVLKLFAAGVVQQGKFLRANFHDKDPQCHQLSINHPQLNLHENH